MALRYFIIRILIAIPTLVVISFMSFGLSRLAPGDPIRQFYGEDLENYSNTVTSLQYADITYANIAKKLGYDKPFFYISLNSVAEPDTFFRILKRDQRIVLNELIDAYGNWPEIQTYYQDVNTLYRSILTVPDSLQEKRNLTKLVRQLFGVSNISEIKARLHTIEQESNSLDANDKTNIIAIVNKLLSDSDAIVKNATTYKNYIPTFTWHGTNNQYHHWLTAFCKGDFGISYKDNRPVYDRLIEAARWTVSINFFSLLLAFLISIPLGVWAAINRGKWSERVSSIIVFLIYSLPPFWIGTMFVEFFTTPEYGIGIFPSVGLGDAPTDATFFEKWQIALPHLILPIACITYPSIAFISRQMKSSMLNTLRMDFVRTAKAKGLSSKSVIWKHAFRNSLFPIITLISSVFPTLLAGSVVIEVIFNIPGMGRLVYESIFARDWPIVYAALMIGAILTLIGNLFADWLYMLLDPRVSFD
ncbi:MAG: ABC transporter permease [Saprospiraceae bacterium]|nr:ABC transporter permease [Saprospiraceae bacterium]